MKCLGSVRRQVASGRLLRAVVGALIALLQSACAPVADGLLLGGAASRNAGQPVVQIGQGQPSGLPVCYALNWPPASAYPVGSSVPQGRPPK